MPDTYREAEMLRAERVDRELSSKKRRSGPSRIISRPPARSADSITPDPAKIVEPLEDDGDDSGRPTGGNDSRYFAPRYETHVFIALSLSLIFVLVAAYNNQKIANNSKMATVVDPKTDPIKFATAWIALFLVLMAMARFRGTDKLAAAFSWLIFVAVLLINGENALALVKSSTTVSKVTVPHQVAPNP